MRIKNLFIANRGEIACRIVRTARKMQIKTLGVYTPQDARSKHVRDLDRAVLLAAGELKENYLNGELLIQTALELHADSIHPGYGFLSENPDFAQKVLEAGLIWIGPPPGSMRALGDKINAKIIAEKISVPVIPWLKLESASEISPGDIASKIGLPLLIKAAHGGGGRGQRVVYEVSQFAESFRAARSESLRSFGSEEVFVERFLEHPRHIEVQIIGDKHGNIHAIGERDCTLQRRNQKIVEEAPAAILDEATRQQILASARALAAEVGYNNAGTIEFLAQKNEKWEFYFMELNARLQVEHPVTEMLWGIDLVEMQIRAAQGESLTLPSEPASNRHAIEVRLCAEDPENHFLPTPGPITDWIIANDGDFRLETGFEVGDVIPQEYDSLFAKLIVCDESRDLAIQKITNTLEDMLIGGLLTNRKFLFDALNHPDFVKNLHSTRWVDAHPPMAPASLDTMDRDLFYWGRRLSSELFVQRDLSGRVRVEPPTSILKDFFPKKGAHGESSPQGLIRVVGDFVLSDGEAILAAGWVSRFELCIAFQRPVEGVSQRRLMFGGKFDVSDVRHHHGPVVAQMPGLVLDVRAKAEDIVPAYTPILVLEAMKIEMPVTIPVNAKILSIGVNAGDRISPGQILVTWEPAE